MSKILFAWELGAGAGHMAPCRGMFEKLCAHGHELTLVLRDLSRAKIVFEGLNVALLQAPVKINLPANPIAQAATYSHILHNVGFEDPFELEAALAAWRNLFKFTRPDLVISDHSPTAMLALRGFPSRKMVIGCGFLIPPDTYPFPNMRPWEPFDEVRARSDEDRIRERINAVLARTGQQPLERIGQLFSEVDESILTTYPELDHYAERQGGEYWGLRRGFQGADFEWPAGDGPRIFAYLRPTPHLHAELHVLKELKHPAIVCSDQITPETQRQFEAPHLRFERRLLNLKKLCAECSIALLNGSHDTAGHLLMAGKPILFIPHILDQWMQAVTVQRLGAGLLASPERPAEFAPKLSAMLGSDSYAKAARRFAARYAANDPAVIEDLLVSRIEELLASGLPRPRRARPSPLQASGEPLPASSSPGAATPVFTEAPAATPVTPPYVVTLVDRNPPAAATALPGDGPDDGGPPDQSLEAAVALHRNGRVQQAVNIYQAILARTPDDPAALHLLGVAHLQAGQFAQSVELIGRAIAIVSTEPSFHSNLGEAFRNLGQFDRAIECCLTALRLQPVYPEACNNLALALQAQGKHKAALARFREAIQYNPRYVVAYNNLGRLLGELGQPEDARACFAKAQQG